MKINITNMDKIAAALESVNGRAAAHTMLSCAVENLADRVESDLASRGVPKKLWRGVRVRFRPAGPGKAYSRKARHVISTRVTLERGSGGWFMVACERSEPWADAPEEYALMLPEDAKNAAVEHALRGVVYA